MTITENKVVTMNYTLKNSEGELLDTSEGREPLVYLHGVGGLIPGLEKQLEGHQAGASVKAVIPCEEAYGSRREDLMHVVDKNGFQGDETMEVGMRVQLDTDNGPAIATIAAIEDEKVTLDMNHPLADMELHFDVEILELRDAEESEIEHGHAHGPGGHQH